MRFVCVYVCACAAGSGLSLRSHYSGSAGGRAYERAVIFVATGKRAAYSVTDNNNKAVVCHINGITQPVPTHH